MPADKAQTNAIFGLVCAADNTNKNKNTEHETEYHEAEMELYTRATLYTKKHKCIRTEKTLYMT